MRPDIPPRGEAQPPPPLPPRQSTSQPRAYTSPLPVNHGGATTLPRHYGNTETEVHLNGGDRVHGEPLTPALPPKTYRASQHRRQQSR